MNKSTDDVAGTSGPISVVSDLSQRIETAIGNSQRTNKPFAVITIQVANLDPYKKKGQQAAIHQLLRELHAGIRKAVHASQFIGFAHDGIVVVLDGIDTGTVDTLSRRLVALSQHILRQGRFQDLTARWTDIIHQFLFPNNPLPLVPIAGWALFPRDGGTPADLVKRSIRHAYEQAQR